MKNKNSPVSSDKTRRRSSGRIMNASERRDRQNDLSAWKAAVILIPVIIVLACGVVLAISLTSYTSIRTESSAAETSYENVSSVSEKDSERMMILVSPKNPLPPDYQPELTKYRGVEVDRLITAYLDDLIKAAEKDGISLSVTEGYISPDQQNELYEDEVQRLVARESETSGRAQEDAEKTAPMGGHADQQLGLSVRFAAAAESFEESDDYFWLLRNSHRFGFVLRYPDEKQSQTEHCFEPALFRYVGEENAHRMQTLNMCLDEYHVYLNSR